MPLLDDSTWINSLHDLPRHQTRRFVFYPTADSPRHANRLCLGDHLADANFHVFLALFQFVTTRRNRDLLFDLLAIVLQHANRHLFLDLLDDSPSDRHRNTPLLFDSLHAFHSDRNTLYDFLFDHPGDIDWLFLQHHLRTPTLLGNLSLHKIGHVTTFDRNFVRSLLWDPVKTGSTPYLLIGLRVAIVRTRQVFQLIVGATRRAERFLDVLSLIDNFCAVRKLGFVRHHAPLLHLRLRDGLANYVATFDLASFGDRPHDRAVFNSIRRLLNITHLVPRSRSVFSFPCGL